MTDHERNAVLLALEAAYDTLKQPSLAYLDQSDFEADREDAVKKLFLALKVMGIAPELVPTGFVIPAT